MYIVEWQVQVGNGGSSWEKIKALTVKLDTIKNNGGDGNSD